MLTFKQFDTSKVQGLSVVFLVTPDEKRNHRCDVFILEVEGEFFRRSELQSNVMEYGLRQLEGIVYLFVGSIDTEGVIHYNETVDANHYQGDYLSRLTTTSEKIIEDFENEHFDIKYFNSLDMVCYSAEELRKPSGVTDIDIPFIEGVVDEINSLLITQKESLFPFL